MVWWVTCALGQVNAEVLAARVSDPGPAVVLDATITASAGNVDSLSLAGGGVGQLLTVHPKPGPRPWMKDRLLLALNARRASYSGDVVESNGLAHLRYTRMVVPRFGGELFLQGQYDAFLLLSRRLLAGVGLRVEIVHREEAGLWGGTGVMGEEEQLSDGTNNQAVRSTSYLSGRVALAPHLLLVNTAYLQPRLDDPRDARFLDELRLETKVNTWLTLGTTAVLRYDSRPPAEVETTDLSIGASASIRWSARPPS
jgi:hypothetical protein